jgi:murein DD-endopeptidase MepM/ murein hydrolase activator NlpD
MYSIWMVLACCLILLSTTCGAPLPSSVDLLASSQETAPVDATPAAPTAMLRSTDVATDTPVPSTATASAIPPETGPATPTSAPAAGSSLITFNAEGTHAFPVAGDLALMTWTHYHWDGSHAVDIEAARHLAADSDEFQRFIHLPVVAIVTGTVAIADNHFGGLALLLHGQDGYSYYYGHLSEQWVADGQTVTAGQELGRIGNTGYNTQYIEPHLHFSIATHTTDDWRWEPDVNAAERFLAWFGLGWQNLDVAEYPADQVSGWPVQVPARVTRGFDEPLEVNPDQGSIDIRPLQGGDDTIPVVATLTGEINVNRATVMGLRVQITNRPAHTTVVYSFLQATTTADGDVIRRGEVIGYIDPGAILNYMLFVQDIPSDPVPTLGDPPWKDSLQKADG